VALEEILKEYWVEAQERVRVEVVELEEEELLKSDCKL